MNNLQFMRIGDHLINPNSIIRLTWHAALAADSMNPPRPACVEVVTNEVRGVLNGAGYGYYSSQDYHQYEVRGPSAERLWAWFNDIAFFPDAEPEGDA